MLKDHALNLRYGNNLLIDQPVKNLSPVKVRTAHSATGREL